MKLFYSPGACSLATHIVLRELGLEFSLEKTDTASARTEAGIDYTTINPNGYVPALELDDGEVVTENLAILQLLADTRPESGLAPSAGTLARTRLHELLSFLSAELHKAYGPFFSGVALDEAAQAAARARIARRLGSLEARLRDGRPYLLGRTFGVADAYAFAVLRWSEGVGVDLAAWPNVAGLYARVRGRASTRAALRSEGLLAGASDADRAVTAIEGVIAAYFEALYHADAERLSAVFHPHAVYATADEAPLLVRDMPTYLEVVAGRVSAASRGAARHEAIDDIELAGDHTARARVRCRFDGRDYVDFLTFVRVQDDWQIISKVFHFVPRSEAR